MTEPKYSLGVRLWRWRLRRHLLHAERTLRSLFPKGYVVVKTGVPVVDEDR